MNNHTTAQGRKNHTKNPTTTLSGSRIRLKKAIRALVAIK